MNKGSLFCFVAVLVDFLSNLFIFDEKRMGWCPVKVDNRFDRY